MSKKKKTSKNKENRWRRQRPFGGALSLIISGLLILWVPISMAPIALMPGSFSILGIVFGGMVFLLGMIGLFLPKYSQLVGVLGIFFAVLSLLGALGGFLIGTILGIIGGAGCFAWMEPEKVDQSPVRYKRTA
ncbi:MAG TPA: DUF6114 domain-containing protein [Candidatus Angelobacter sp.]|nr:DUF6114 domain-containing protein [Candidatus Angelobacter sp.]